MSCITDDSRNSTCRGRERNGRHDRCQAGNQTFTAASQASRHARRWQCTTPAAHRMPPPSADAYSRAALRRKPSTSGPEKLRIPFNDAILVIGGRTGPASRFAPERKATIPAGHTGLGSDPDCCLLRASRRPRHRGPGCAGSCGRAARQRGPQTPIPPPSGYSMMPTSCSRDGEGSRRHLKGRRLRGRVGGDVASAA